MEKGKQVENSNSSSTFATDLFGPKDSKTSSSSSGIFASVFGPASTGLGRDKSHSCATPHMAWSKTHDSEYKNVHGSRGYNGVSNKEGCPMTSQNGVAGHDNDPCYFNSSIFYGGQQVYSPNNPTNHTNPSHHHVYKRDEGKDDDDSNGNNSNYASRGNWWQGSLYY